MAETTKITRMQQRRGLKQDLPKPLRPGEIGFATDSRQIYIGADTKDPVSDIYNKTGVFEKTSSAQSTTTSFANVQIIKFTVPHKVYDKGDFDGVTDSVSWTPATDVASSSTSTQYSRLNKVFRSSDTHFKNIFTGNVFVATDLSVVQEGKRLEPSPVATIASSDDYYFTQTGDLTLSNHTHQLQLRTSPSGADAISVAYYGNTQVINAISNTKIGVTTTDGFYEAKNISSYRQLNNKNIRVTPGTGVGFIGMQFKHIQVATDVKVAPTQASVSAAGDLGNLFLTKNEDIDDNVAATSTSSQVTLTGNITADAYNVSGAYNHVYVTNGSDWLDNKVLKVTSYDSANAQIIASLPSNSSSITRAVTTLSNVNSNVQITVGSVQDTEVGDSIYFLEAANVSGLHEVEADITAVSTLNNTIDLDLDFSSVSNSAVSVSAVVFKDGVNSNVVVNSDRHGIPNGNTVTLKTAGTGIGNFTAEVTGNANTFIVNYGTNITANIIDLSFTPVVSNATVSATPVFAADLSSADSIESAKTTTNNYNKWPKLSSIPGTPNKLYLTHAEAVQKTPFNFKIHNDSKDTLSSLGLTGGEYTKQNATVKAKLEEWMDSVRDNVNLNLFKEIYSNQEFQSPSQFNTWDLKIDSAFGEMSFESRDEAKDFSQILNNLYFESTNTDIRGLLNIKTNIEFLTSEALAAGTATTSFTSPEQLTLSTGLQTVSELGLALADDFQTLIVEYSMVGGTSSNRYRRVGRLMYSGDNLTDEIALNDNFTDVATGVTGDVQFSGNIDGSSAVIQVNNTLNPSTDLTMRYIVRRWGD